MLASMSGPLELYIIFFPHDYFEVLTKITDSQTEMLPDLYATLKTNHYARWIFYDGPKHWRREGEHSPIFAISISGFPKQAANASFIF